MYVGLHVKYRLFLSEFTKHEFSQHVFEEFTSIEFQENPSSGSRDVSCGQTGTQADMTKVILVSCNFANAPQSRPPLCQITKHMTTRRYQHLQTKSWYCTPQSFDIAHHEAHSQYVVQQWSFVTVLTWACPRRRNCLLCCATSHVQRRKHKGPDQEWICDSVLPGQGSGTSNWAEIVDCGFYDVSASAIGLWRCMTSRWWRDDQQHVAGSGRGLICSPVTAFNWRNSVQPRRLVCLSLAVPCPNTLLGRHCQ